MSVIAKRDSGYIATKDELTSVAEDTVTNLNELRAAINSHASALNLHRFLLEKFIPAGLLEQACNEWYEVQKKLIEEELAQGHATVEA
jgi:hypothetical protein